MPPPIQQVCVWWRGDDKRYRFFRQILGDVARIIGDGKLRGIGKQRLLIEPLPTQLDVLFVQIEAHSIAPQIAGRYQSGPTTDKWIQHQLAAMSEKLDAAR